MKKQEVTKSESIEWRFRWPGWQAAAKRIIEGQFGLCIIDTLTRAFPAMKQNEGEAVTNALSPLQEFGLSKKVLIVGIDHERKTVPGSIHSMDEVLGSQAKTAVADAILQLHRDQGGHHTVLTAESIGEPPSSGEKRTRNWKPRTPRVGMPRWFRSIMKV